MHHRNILILGDFIFFFFFCGEGEIADLTSEFFTVALKKFGFKISQANFLKVLLFEKWQSIQINVHCTQIYSSCWERETIFYTIRGPTF